MSCNFKIWNPTSLFNNDICNYCYKTLWGSGRVVSHEKGHFPLHLECLNSPECGHCRQLILNYDNLHFLPQPDYNKIFNQLSEQDRLKAISPEEYQKLLKKACHLSDLELAQRCIDSGHIENDDLYDGLKITNDVVLANLLLDSITNESRAVGLYRRGELAKSVKNKPLILALLRGKGVYNERIFRQTPTLSIFATRAFFFAFVLLYLSMSFSKA